MEDMDMVVLDMLDLDMLVLEIRSFTSVEGSLGVVIGHSIFISVWFRSSLLLYIWGRGMVSWRSMHNWGMVSWSGMDNRGMVSWRSMNNWGMVSWSSNNRGMVSWSSNSWGMPM